MKKVFIISLFICGFFLLGDSDVFGLELNETQKKVWAAVEAGWELIKQGDLEAISAHDSVEGSLSWWSSRSEPFEKEDMMLQYRRWFNFNKPVSYELTPLNIHIVGNFANVFFLYTWRGTGSIESGRQMNTYVKQDDQWKFVGGMGCSCNKLPYCR